jgi:hypothetical protein
MEQEEKNGQCGQCACQMEEDSGDPEDLVLDFSKMNAEEKREYLYKLLRSRSWGS